MSDERRVDIASWKYEFHWEIANFGAIWNNLDEDELEDDYLISPTFTTEHINGEYIDWTLELYPKGELDDFKEHSSIFLFSNLPIRALPTFIVINNKGEIIEHITLHECLFDEETGWGFDTFILQDSKHEILNNDKLTIACKIKYINSELESAVRLYNTSEKRKLDGEFNDEVVTHLQDNYEALLENSKFSDVSLIAEGKAIDVHKNILASRNLVFAAMFDAEMKTKQGNTVEISDIRYDVLMEMLRFIYAGKVYDIVDELAFELAFAADKYALDDLKIICEKTMIENFSPDNVIECLRNAETLRMDMLKKKAIEYIVNEESDVIEKSEFDLLPIDIACKIYLYRSLASVI